MSTGEGESIGRNAVFALLTQVATGAFTAVITIFLVRELGPSDYGTFALALSITSLLSIVTGTAPGASAGRFLAERHGDWGAVTGILGMVIPFRLLMSGAVAVALFAAAGLIANAYDAPQLETPLRVLAIAYFGQTVFLFIRTVFISLRRTPRAFALVISESAVEFTAVISIVSLGGGVTGAAAGRSIGYAFGALLGVVLLQRMLGRSPIFGTGPSPVARRVFLGYASTLLVVVVTDAVFAQLAPLMLGAYLTTAAVGFFTAPATLLPFMSYLGAALEQGIAPRMAKHEREERPTAAHELGLKYMVIAQATATPFLVVWAAPITELLFGDGYGESADVLRLLAPVAFLVGVNPLFQSPISYAGEARRRIPASIAALAVAATLNAILIPDIGVNGAAIGASAGYVVYVGWHAKIARDVLGIDLGPLAVTLLKTAVAACLAGGVLALIGTDPSVGGWVAGILGAPAAYLSALVLLRELDRSDLTRAVQAPLRMLRGRPSG
jgi:O-antigen/teichoic acid export membrane protein